MKQLDGIKVFLGKIPSKTKKIIGIGFGVAIVFSVIVALTLNHKTYQSLFSGLTDMEASEIMGKLQESGVDYQYHDGNILVDEKLVDKTKATLVSEGYPKSGFTYDVFKNNSSLMTTDYEKRTYKIYELQDRIASTINLFDGVQNATVTIALGEEQKYALNDKDLEEASASVVVQMKDGGSPTPEQVAGIQNLVAKSIPQMTIEHVGVFDGNGNDVSIKDGIDDPASTSAKRASMEQELEDAIESNVLKILAPFYGSNNVRVSVKSRINMEKKIKEGVNYTAPNEEDQTGIVSNQQLNAEADTVEGTAAGVPGADTNADIAEYNVQVGQDGNESFYSKSSETSYLVNQTKEQIQDNGGTLEDLTISVAINGTDLGQLNVDNIREMVGNAAGMARDVQAEKISIANAPFYQMEVNDKPVDEAKTWKDYLPLIIAGGVLLVVLLIITIVSIVVAKKRKKAYRLAMEELEASRLAENNTTYNLAEELKAAEPDKGQELVASIKEFAEQNPEISAQLLKSWLRGGDGDGR